MDFWSFLARFADIAAVITFPAVVGGALTVYAGWNRNLGSTRIALATILLLLGGFAYIVDLGSRFSWFSSMQPLEDVYDRRFADQVVVVDGKAFHGCLFENVTFQYSTGNFLFDNVAITGNSNFQTPNGDVTNAIKLLGAIGKLEPAFGASWGNVSPDKFVPQ